MLELSNEFRKTMINVLRAILEKVDNMQEQMVMEAERWNSKKESKWNVRN